MSVQGTHSLRKLVDKGAKHDLHEVQGPVHMWLLNKRHVPQCKTAKKVSMVPMHE